MIKVYTHTDHFHLIRKWFSERGMPVPPADYLPDCGFVADGVAIGFLLKTNSKVARIDNVIVDPAADVETRDTALQLLFHALESEAKRSSFAMIEAFPGAPKMVGRFALRRYRKVGEYTLMVKEV